MKKKPKLMGNQFLLNGKTLSKQQAESSARKYLFAVCYDFSCTRIIISSVITRYISYTIYADQGTDKSKRDCGGHVRTFLMTYYYFDSVVRGGPRIQKFLVGKWGWGWEWGRGSLVQKGLLNVFVANYFSQRRPRVSQPVNAGRHWRSEYCFASRSEQIIGG